MTPDDLYRAIKVADPDLMITREWAERVIAALSTTPAPDRNAILDEVMEAVADAPTFGDQSVLHYRSNLLNRLMMLRQIERAPHDQ